MWAGGHAGALMGVGTGGRQGVADLMSHLCDHNIVRFANLGSNVSVLLLLQGMLDFLHLEHGRCLLHKELLILDLLVLEHSGSIILRHVLPGADLGLGWMDWHGCDGSWHGCDRHTGKGRCCTRQALLLEQGRRCLILPLRLLAPEIRRPGRCAAGLSLLPGRREWGSLWRLHEAVPKQSMLLLEQRG